MRRMMTEVLLGATDDGIQFVAKEVINEALLHRQRVMTQAAPDVLGLLGYSSDSDSDDGGRSAAHAAAAAKGPAVLKDGYGVPVLGSSLEPQHPDNHAATSSYDPSAAEHTAIGDPDLDGAEMDELDGDPLDEGNEYHHHHHQRHDQHVERPDMASRSYREGSSSAGKVSAGTDMSSYHTVAPPSGIDGSSSMSYRSEYRGIANADVTAASTVVMDDDRSRESDKLHHHRSKHSRRDRDRERDRERDRDYSPRRESRHGGDRSPKHHRKHSRRSPSPSSSSSRSKKRYHEHDERSHSRSPSHRHKHSSKRR
eukprot:scpid17030/ scgid5176/ 